MRAEKRDQPWLFRTYSGHSSAAASNQLYRTNLARGQTGLSIAFDLPTQTGYDADHPLAKIKGRFAPELLRDHLQLVLSSRSEVFDRRDYGIHAVRHWRIADMNLRRKLLLAGVGWCSMPRNLVAADLKAGRLVALKPLRWEGSDRMPRFPLVIAHRRDKALGPAARWLIAHVAAGEAKLRPTPRRSRSRTASSGRSR